MIHIGIRNVSCVELDAIGMLLWFLKTRGAEVGFFSKSFDLGVSGNMYEKGTDSALKELCFISVLILE